MQNKSNNNAPRHFNLTARILHWLMAVAILAMLFIGVGMTTSITWRPWLIYPSSFRNRNLIIGHHKINKSTLFSNSTFAADCTTLAGIYGPCITLAALYFNV